MTTSPSEPAEGASSQYPFGEVIDTPTRADLIGMGALVPVPDELVREAGIGVPVALTRAVWEGCVAWTEADDQRKPAALQDETGRLWDLLWLTRATIVRSRGKTHATLRLRRVPREGSDVRARLVTLQVVIGPGDDGEPVLTVMEPGED